MTIIVGVHDPENHETWIGTDRRTTEDNLNLDPMRPHPLPPKWVIAGRWVIASAGDVAVIDLYRQHATELALCPDVRSLTHKMREFIAADPHMSWNSKNEGSLQTAELEGLIGSSDGLWAWGADFYPLPMSAWTQGSGGSVGLGALWAAQDLDLPYLAWCELAIQAATRFKPDTCGGQPAVGYMGLDGWTTVRA